MAVEGDLKDLEITSLIQVLCTERRSAGVVVRRRGEEGVIFLDQGEVVHAMLGPLEGEKAVLQLFTWRDGTFRITDQARARTRTITSGWRHLMMEAMRQLDESHRDLGIQGSFIQSGFLGSHGGQNLLEREAADAHLEGQLMHLLSRLEQGMAHWQEDKHRKRPLQALEQLCEMTHQVVDVAEREAPTGVAASSLEPALIAAIRKYPMARLLTLQGSRLSVANALNLYRTWAEDVGERQRVFREIARGISSILETYFELLTQSFHSPGSSAEWRESYGVFRRDLALAIDRLPF